MFYLSISCGEVNGIHLFDTYVEHKTEGSENL